MNNKNHRDAATKEARLEVRFSLSGEVEGPAFEALLKARDETIIEMGKDCVPIRITYPINGNAYLIEFDDEDKKSLAGCEWLAVHLLRRGCRVFISKNRFFVNTYMSFCELGKEINALMLKMPDDVEFWEMLKCCEEF